MKNRSFDVMKIDALKLELIDWLNKLKDYQTLQKILFLKKEAEEKKKVKRKAGSGKHLISYMADDFNEPLDHFKDYMPS